MDKAPYAAMQLDIEKGIVYMRSYNTAKLRRQRVAHELVSLKVASWL